MAVVCRRLAGDDPRFKIREVASIPEWPTNMHVFMQPCAGQNLLLANIDSGIAVVRKIAEQHPFI